MELLLNNFRYLKMDEQSSLENINYASQNVQIILESLVHSIGRGLSADFQFPSAR
jgi:hypothetical protein